MPKKKNEFFKHLEAIQTSKQYNYDSSYNSFVTSLGLSQHVDCIFPVNDMNLYWQVVTPKMHYDYLFMMVRGTRRPFVKWAKPEVRDDITLVMEEYQVSRKVALEYLQLLDDEALQRIHQSRDKGTLT